MLVRFHRSPNPKCDGERAYIHSPTSLALILNPTRHRYHTPDRFELEQLLPVQRGPNQSRPYQFATISASGQYPLEPPRCKRKNDIIDV